MSPAIIRQVGATRLDRPMSVSHITWPEAKDYFKSYSHGRVDEEGEYAFIYAQDLVRQSDNGEMLYIGRAGVGGIEFAYKRGSTEIWAFYPIEGELIWKAEGIDEFVQGWLRGDISV